VLGTESRLRETNFTYRRDLPTADLTAAALRHFAAGVDVVLWGHFHRSWVFEQGNREARIVPGWLETGAVVWIGEDGKPAVEAERNGQFVDSSSCSWYQGDEKRAEAR
jgi:hypothetical protein